MDSDHQNDEIRQLKDQLEEINREKEKYRLIADFTNDFEYWMDPKGVFKYISPGSRSVTGYVPDSFYQEPDLFYQITHPDDSTVFTEYIQKVLDLTIIDENLSFRIVTRSKLIKHCEITSKSVYDPMGKYLGQRGSIRDVSRLIESRRKVKEIGDKHVFEEQAKNRFKVVAEKRDRELTTTLLQMSQKNELLQHISRKLDSLDISKKDDQKAVKELQARIRNEINSLGVWDEFKLHFENSYPGFFERIVARFPKITSKDLKLCAYIRLQLSTKEMAALLNITPKSAEISRVRLRKKLGLQRKDDLGVFLNSV